MDPISSGTTGAEVEDVQRRLRDLALLAADHESGVFCTQTELAVRQLQRQCGLPSDGVVDAETWSALVAASFRLGDRMLFETRPMLRGEDVRELQLRLNLLGFDAGFDDGIFGPATRAALEAFQSEVGLDADGMLGPSSVDHLLRLQRDHHGEPAYLARERSQLRRARRASVSGARVLLDPANGPDVPGWIAPDGTPEHAITWAIASAVEGRLAVLGAKVLLSRGPRTSPSAAERAALANSADAELIVSIGLNGSTSPLDRGATAAYFGTHRSESEVGRRLAELLLERTVGALGGPDCRSHPATVSILRMSRAPAAVLEPGFVTNPQDAELLCDASVQRRIADAVVDGISAFLTERHI